MSENNTLDLQAIETLRSLNPEDGEGFLKELIEIYLQDTPTHLAEVENGLLANDPNQVMRAAHSIKGSSCNFGAGRFAEIAHSIELEAKAGSLETTPANLIKLKAEYSMVEAALSAIVKGT